MGNSPLTRNVVDELKHRDEPTYWLAWSALKKLLPAGVPLAATVLASSEKAAPVGKPPAATTGSTVLAP